MRPGLMIKIASAAIAQDGTITVAFSLTDPQGAPLDRTGVSTRRARFRSPSSPRTSRPGQTQYVDYMTRSADRRGLRDGDAGGRAKTTGCSRLSGTAINTRFSTHAPAGFNAAVTHTIGIYGSRNLTEFDLGTNYASATFNFVPNGSRGHA